MLEFQNVSVQVSGGVLRSRKQQILNDISFTLSDGESLGIIGKSGSGKTTIANAILRLVRCSAGDIWIDGKSVRTGYSRLELAKQVQLITQNPETSFDPDQSVSNSFQEVLKTHGLLSKGTTVEEIAGPLLREVGLDGVDLGKLPGCFSGGELQRLSIVRALLVSPRILIFDEADSMLDTALRVRLFDTLDALIRNRGLSYIYITHDIRILPRLVENVLLIDDGRAVEYGPVGLLRTSERPFIKELRDAIVLEPKVHNECEKGWMMQCQTSE